VILVSGKSDPSCQDLLRLESERNVLQPPQALYQQPCSEDERDGKRNLGGDEESTQESSGAGRCGPAFLQHLVPSLRPRNQCGGESHENSREQRDCKCEKQYSPINLYRSRSRNFRRAKGLQSGREHCRKSDTGEPAHATED